MTQILLRKPRLYLAYGSNLNQRAMARRCPDAKPYGWVLMENGRLVFRGVADVAYEPGHAVPCGLWEISARDERALDAYEGVGAGLYGKYDVKIGRNKTALLYLMENTHGIYPPSEWYADVIREGYADFGIDESYLDAAVEHCFRSKDPCERTIFRRRRQRDTQHQRRLVQMPESVAIERLARAMA